jgi:hypothetical protein
MEPVIHTFPADWSSLPDFTHPFPAHAWTVPVGGGVGRIMKLGFQPINWQAESYGNAVYPAGTSSWTMRVQIAFLFPKLSPEEKKALMEEQLKKLEQEQQKTQQKK